MHRAHTEYVQIPVMIEGHGNRASQILWADIKMGMIFELNRQVVWLPLHGSCFMPVGTIITRPFNILKIRKPVHKKFSADELVSVFILSAFKEFYEIRNPVFHNCLPNCSYGQRVSVAKRRYLLFGSYRWVSLRSTHLQSHPRRSAIRARIVGAFQTPVLVQHHGAGVAHDVGIRLVQNFDLVTGVGERVDEIAIEARLNA
jgi:hypothetical protein